MKSTTPAAVFAPARKSGALGHGLLPTLLAHLTHPAHLASRCVRWLLLVLLPLATGAVPGSAHAQDSAQQLPSITLSAGMHRISAEVARTPEQRAIGLMHRKAMPQHAGMIFVFERPEPLCFWMKNTLIPLSIAFLQDDGTILNIEEMKPQTLNSHCSLKPARFALEMNAGWFSKRGLKPGDKVSGDVFK